MKVEIWWDVACPFCYMGKRRFEKALKELPPGTEVDVRWRSYQMSPTSPKGVGEPVIDFLVRHKGVTRSVAESLCKGATASAAGDGLVFRFDIAVNANTFDAHRLVHFAAANGKADPMKERLFSAYFERGESVGDLEQLVKMAKEVGLDPTAARDVLSSDKYSTEVRTDQADAKKAGVSGVPFFLVDGKKSFSGAQSVKVIAGILKDTITE